MDYIIVQAGGIMSAFQNLFHVGGVTGMEDLLRKDQWNMA